MGQSKQEKAMMINLQKLRDERRKKLAFASIKRGDTVKIKIPFEFLPISPNINPQRKIVKVFALGSPNKDGFFKVRLKKVSGENRLIHSASVRTADVISVNEVGSIHEAIKNTPRRSIRY